MNPSESREKLPGRRSCCSGMDPTCASAATCAADGWDEVERLRPDRDRFRQHSLMLNRVAWEIHQAMGVIPEGATSHCGPIITDELPRICELIRKGLEVERG